MTATPELTPKEEKRIYLDTCASETVFPAWAVKDRIESQQTAKMIYATTGGGSFTANTSAIIRLPVTLMDGQKQTIRIKGHIGPNTISCLCKPKCLHLLLKPEDSWALLEDAE
eukprot:GHVU01176977.1.p1 GENE.GHVU01176977.1~~GHVU01176977.1.p1  ORF type:complete len:121 (+),score=16.70 GHVU01176977.1:27-365(+)